MDTQESDLTTRMYVCGPTVYDDSHLGHARTYMTVDILMRIMNSIANTKTHLVMNITDIDDKIIKKAADTNSNGWSDIAKQYEKSFFESMAKLNVKLPDTIIRVSDVMPQIILYIQKIIDNGFAYVTSDSSVYFDTNEYIRHGYEFDNTIDDDERAYHSTLSPALRLQKRNKKDFALWKGRLASEVGFNAEFVCNEEKITSWGRPGWHIECSAMIHETIGPNLDIHFGGIDLKFPHHYNERLQAHAYYHPKFIPTSNHEETTTDSSIATAPYSPWPSTISTEIASATDSYVATAPYSPWSSKFHHVGHLCIKGLKMSKSLKNFTTIDEALKEINANQMRWMFMIHKWTDQMDFSDDTVTQAKVFDNIVSNFLNRIVNYPFDRLHSKYNDKEFVLADYFHQSKSKIISELMAFKLDTASLVFFDLIGKTNSYTGMTDPNACLVRKIYDWVLQLVTILGFEYQKSSDGSTGADIMNVLISTRSELRKMTRDPNFTKEIKQKIFQILDTERNILLPSIGITLQDTKDSSSWFKN